MKPKYIIRSVAAVIGTLCFVAGVQAQEVQGTTVANGTMNVVVSSDTVCTVTPTVTMPTVTATSKWQNFGTVEFGCKSGAGTDTNATIGFDNATTVVSDFASASGKEYVINTNSSGNAITAGQYLFKFADNTNVSSGAADADALAAGFLNGLVAKTVTAGNGIANLSGFMKSSATPENVTIPLMVMAWN